MNVGATTVAGSIETCYGDHITGGPDAATANWGDDWRTPTYSDFENLWIACTGSNYPLATPVEPTNEISSGGIYWLSASQTIEPDYAGVAGVLFVSNSDISKHVFFPAAGEVLWGELQGAGTNGYYWSYSPDDSGGYFMGFDSSRISLKDVGSGILGMSIRPVRE